MQVILITCCSTADDLATFNAKFGLELENVNWKNRTCANGGVWKRVQLTHEVALQTIHELNISIKYLHRFIHEKHVQTS